MRLSAWCAVLATEMRAHRGRGLVLVACVFLVGFGCGLAAHAWSWIQRDVSPYVELLFPEERLIVRPAAMDLLFLRMEGSRLGRQTVREIESLPMVARVYPQATARFPLSADVQMGLLGVGFQTEIVLHGVDRALVAADLEDPSLFRWDQDSREPVPVVVSVYFLDLYNMGLAEGSRMPKLAPAAAIGREFDLQLGESVVSFERLPNRRTQRARVIGLARDPLLMGVIAPREVVERWNAEFASEDSPTYSLLHVDLRPEADPSEAVASITGKGLRVEQRADQLEALKRAIRGAELVLAGFVLLVGALGTVGVVATMALSSTERRARWGLMRASGLTPLGLASLMMGELLVLASLGGGLAIGLLVGCLQLSGHYAEGMGLPLSLLPGDPFAVTPLGVMVAGLLGIVLLGVSGIVFSGSSLWREPNVLLAERDL